jgi:hypothetical protein
VQSAEKCRVPVAVSFSDPVAGLSEGGLSVTGGSIYSIERVNATLYSVWVVPSESVLTIQVLKDAVGPWGNALSDISSAVLLEVVSRDAPVAESSPITSVSVVSPLPFTYTAADVSVMNGDPIDAETSPFIVIPRASGVVEITVAANVSRIGVLAATLRVDFWPFFTFNQPTWRDYEQAELSCLGAEVFVVDLGEVENARYLMGGVSSGTYQNSILLNLVPSLLWIAESGWNANWPGRAYFGE